MTMLAAGGLDGTIRLHIYSVAEPNLLRRLAGHDGAVSSLALKGSGGRDGNAGFEGGSGGSGAGGGAGTLLVSGSHDRTACVWDLAAQGE